MAASAAIGASAFYLAVAPAPTGASSAFSHRLGIDRCVNYADTIFNTNCNALKFKNQGLKQEMKIGATIRTLRLQRSLSQGDIEKRTGLLRCYLSRVENGHTVPSLETLSKIAQSLEIPLAQFFAESPEQAEIPLQKISDDELRFLTQIRRYSSSLNDSDKKLLLAMVKKFATSSSPAQVNA